VLMRVFDGGRLVREISPGASPTRRSTNGDTRDPPADLALAASIGLTEVRPFLPKTSLASAPKILSAIRSLADAASSRLRHSQGVRECEAAG
jgi:hypothetical protein